MISGLYLRNFSRFSVIGPRKHHKTISRSTDEENHLWTNVLILVLMVLIEFFSFISIVTKKVKFKIQSLNKYIKSCKLKIRHFRSKIIKMITRVNSRICTNYPLHSRFSRIRQWSFSWKFLKIVCIWMRKNPRI